MSPEEIQRRLPEIVPFVRHLGLSIDEVGPGAVTATQPDRPEVQNHIGTLHAGALYSLGESAAGAVALALFGDLGPRAFIVLKGASIAHFKARAGDTVARAALVGEPAAIRAAFDVDGKVDFDVAVRFAVADTEVAAATYTLAVRVARGGRH